MQNNQYKLSISLNGNLDLDVMYWVHSLFGVGLIHFDQDYVVIEMINEYGSMDIDALTRMLQNRGFTVNVREHCF